MESIRFDEFIKLNRGFDLPDYKIEQGKYPVITSTNIKAYHKEYKVEGPMVVTGRSGSLGKVQYIDGKCWPLNTSLYVKDYKNNYPRYVFYFLQTMHLEQYNAGAGVPTLNQNHLHSLKIQVHEKELQQKIASILSTYDTLIENNNRRIRLLEQMAENLYKEWFVRFRFPGHEKLENGLPKEWDIRIKDLTQLKSGYAFKSSWFVDEGEAIAKIKDIGETIMDTSSFSYVSKDNCIKAEKFLLTEGDLTIALTGATIGKISIVPKHKGNIYTNQRLGKFFLGKNPIEKLPFLYCLFKQKAMVSNIINLSNSSSAQPNISPEQIESIKILGDKEVINSFNKACKHIFSMILSIHSQNTLLTRQRDLLLPRLMSGKLEVKP